VNACAISCTHSFSFCSQRRRHHPRADGRGQPNREAHGGAFEEPGLRNRRRHHWSRRHGRRASREGGAPTGKGDSPHQDRRGLRNGV